MTDDTGPVTDRLRDEGPEPRTAVDAVFPLVYDELRRLAHDQLSGRPRGSTVSTTVLLHEAYLRLADQTGARFPDRLHFFAYASRVMRSILVDRARARGARKRGGGWRAVGLDTANLPADEQAEWVLDLDEALTRLGTEDSRAARVVECRFFGGLTEAETAGVLGVTERTVRRDWVKARTWLHADLTAEAGGPGAG